MKIATHIKKIATVGAISSLLLILTSAHSKAPKLDPIPLEPSNPTTESPALHRQVNTSNQLPTATNQDRQADTSYLRFRNEASRQAFLDDNSLDPSQLFPIGKLGVYGIRGQNLITSSGIEVFINQPYSALLTPVDSLAPSQWHLINTNTLPAWNHQTGKTNTTVAVIDTGFGLNVSDLTNKWAENSGETGPTSNEGPAPNCTSRSLSINKRCNNLDDDNDGYIDNYLGWDFTTDTNNVSAGKTAPNASGAYHGTAVASLIAAQANNSTGGTGISWGSKILPLQALDDNGDGNTISVALAIRYAVDKGVDVINMSLGADADDPLVSEQIDYAIQNNVTVVAASGNDGCNCIAYPARYPSVIAVGATNSTNSLASFSNYGSNLDLVAPGVGLCSTIWTNSNPAGINSCGLNGTSFSSPLVAGTAALLLSQNPALSPSQVSAALTGTATKLTPMNNANFTVLYGYGLLNILASLTDVSTTSCIGLPLSASRIALPEISASLTGYEYDKFNSTCYSPQNDVTYTIRAINTQTNQLVPIATSIPAIGTRSLQQDLLTANLAPGTWIIQSYLITSGGIQSMTREKAVVISN